MGKKTEHLTALIIATVATILGGIFVFYYQQSQQTSLPATESTSQKKSAPDTVYVKSLVTPAEQKQPRPLQNVTQSGGVNQVHYGSGDNIGGDKIGGNKIENNK